VALAWAGPLSRWYARSSGRDAAALRVGVEAWRTQLCSAVAAKVAQQLAWDEGSDVAVDFDMGDAGWMALRLFAFYAERSDLELPDTVPPLLELDAQWRAAADEKFAKSKFGHLLACSVWLPGDFPVTLRAPMPDGAAAEIGSLAVLADQMKWLNQRTFAADANELASWSAFPATAGGDLLTGARRGLSALSSAVAVAVGQRVPVLVADG
jgi:hypothetical protein